MSVINKIQYFFWASYRRKLLDKYQQNYSDLYQGIVLDIGGRDRGNFHKPKDKVKKWIFADIDKEHKPNIILDVANMKDVESESIDVVNAIELFEHVERIEDGIRECVRVLKNGGIMIMSIPFLYPIHADPHDYQRWTEKKLKLILQENNLEIEKIAIMGRFFTVLVDMLKVLNKSLPLPFRLCGYLLMPLYSLFTTFDSLKIISEHNLLGKYTTGYFIIAKKIS